MKEQYDVVGIGISSVDDLFFVSDNPTANCKVPIERHARCGGGPACTAIAAIGVLQGSASYIARLGVDEVSSYIRAELRRRNIDVSRIIEDPQAAPYHCIIVIDARGNRMVLYDPSHYRVVTSADVSDSLLRSTKLLLLDYLTEPAATGIAEKARKLGVKTLGDIENRSESALKLAELVDYLIVPEDFAAWATGDSRPEFACAQLAKFERTATIVTCGSKGGYYSIPRNKDAVHYPAFPIEVSDTTGCGDVFHGAFALAAARGAEVHDAVVFASAAAALKANAMDGSNHGWDALPTLESVFTLLRARLREPEKMPLLRRLEEIGLRGERMVAATARA